MKKTLAVITLCFSVLASQAFAATGEVASASDDRIKLITYDETSVYTITTRFSYQTNIVFGAHEEIDTVSVGDRSLWQIIPSGNRLFIRPMEEGVITNMTVLTNKHSYQFDLKSLAADKKEGNIYVAKFVYKDDKPRVVAPEPAPAPAPTPTTFTPLPVTAPTPAPAPAASNEAFPPSAYKAYTPTSPVYSPPPEAVHTLPTVEARPINPNYNYTYGGPDDLAPLQVYDDGSSTYIKFRDMTQPMPNVFVVDSNQEQAVSYQLKDGAMVVGTVVPELMLKTSAGTVRVYNESLTPGS